MQLDDWTGSGDKTDIARRKRLTVGYAVGAVTVTVALTFITYSSHGQAFEREDTIDVSLVEAPIVPDEPEVEVEPEPKPQVVKKKRPSSAKVAVATPKDVPDGVPDEADPTQTGGSDVDDDVFDDAGSGQIVASPKPAAVVKTEPPPPPAPVLVVSEREHSRPPVPLSQPSPAYPRAAKSAGIEGTVVVRFLVTTQGTVDEVRVVRGDSALVAAVVEAVKRWRFEPGTYRRSPVAVWRTASFPFRIRS